MNLNLTAEFIDKELQALCQFNATPGKGITRFPYTKEAKEACAYLAKLMELAGLQVRMDNSGSLIGRLEGAVPETIMVGSHFDTVKNGGVYDGNAGVICAIALAAELVRQGIKPYYSLEIIATNDEEGARFHAGLFSGKVLAGQLSVEDIKGFVDADGISIYQAMEGYGLKPEEINQHVRHDLKAFMEIHIEQGPVLETAGKSIGIVEAIVGIHRALITVHGRADHSGTMPMNMRKDALELATKAISKIGDRARSYPGSVATVGFLQVEPSVMNIVPQKVSFTVDIRSVDQEAIDGQYKALVEDLQQLSATMDMPVEIEELMDQPPVRMDVEMGKILASSCEKNGYSYMHLPSGAGHDAQIFAERMPAVMLFVPSVGGRSHCPEEESSPMDLAKATHVLYDLVVKMQSKEK